MGKKSLLLLLSVCLFSFILFGCTKVSTSSNIDLTLNEPVIKTKNSINIIVDPKIELLSIVQLLSGYDKINSTLMTDASFEYKDKVIEYFSEFKNHKAVKQFSKMSKSGFTYDAPPGLVLFADDNLNVRKDVELTEYIIKRAGGEEKIIRLFDALKEFCVDTNFDDFYNSNIDYYNEITDNTLLLMKDDTNIIEQLEEYYGIKQKSYNVILTSLYGKGAYGPKIQNIDGDTEIYSVLGCIGVSKNGYPFFITNNDYFTYLQQHEFSHSFINPITEKNIKLANSYDVLFGPIKDKMKSMAYSSWETCLNEHIIRALTARFVYNDGNSEDTNTLYKEKNQGFIYVESLFNKLEEYEKNRDKYPTIEDFYPELLKALDEFKTK